MQMNIEAFIITNGRSTFKYALKSLEGQYPAIKITVIRDMLWVDAVNKCVKMCKSRFFIRVDDDMFLHPLCVEYMYNKAARFPKRLASYNCTLLEDWQHKVSGFVKVYQRDTVQKMGGFHINKFGKIDKPFNISAKEHKRIIKKDNSIVGIHACVPWEEQKKYRVLWRTNSKTELRRSKSYIVAQKTYRKSMEDQYALINKLRSKNKRRKSGFFYFLKNSS